MTDILDKLERLQKLRESGAITDEEFFKQKDNIINQESRTESDLSVISERDNLINDYFKSNNRFRNYKIFSLILLFVNLSITVASSNIDIKNSYYPYLIVFSIFVINFSINILYKRAPISAIAVVASFLSISIYDILSSIFERPSLSLVGGLIAFVSVCTHGYKGSSYFAHEEGEAELLSPIIQVLLAALLIVGMVLGLNLLSKSMEASVNGSSSSEVSQNTQDENLNAAGDFKLAKGSCELTVEGTNYIDGQCLIDSDDDGSFYVFQNADRTGYFAVVQIDGNSAEGYWNGAPDSTHAQTPLGTLKNDGNCWVNATNSTRICTSSEAAARVGNTNGEQTTWDCSSVYGDKILVTIMADEYRFYPRNPDGGALSGKLVKSAKEENAYTGGYDTYLNLIDSGTAPKSWSIYVGDKGPALFHYSELSGDGSECTLPGEDPKYTTN
jgi:hypothetical protein